jgi:hypothetical protein
VTQPAGVDRTVIGYVQTHRRIALLLIDEAGGVGVRLGDIPAADRNLLNSKGTVLSDLALVSYDYFARTYTLTELGRTTVALLRLGADS